MTAPRPSGGKIKISGGKFGTDPGFRPIFLEMKNSPARGGGAECSWKKQLLDFDSSADFGQLFLDLFAFFLGSAFLDGLGGGFHEVLGFLQAQAGQLADNLDDLDLLGASVLQDGVELGLFFFSGSSASSVSRTCSASDGANSASCTGCSEIAYRFFRLKYGSSRGSGQGFGRA